MEVRPRFAELVAGPSPLAPEQLAEGAVLVGTVVHPDLDPQADLGRLVALADETEPGASVPDLAHELFGSGRLRGNPGDYYDPDNSVIGRVIDRGLGIPISLAVVFIEIARRRGHRVDGVGMPGHFLTRHGDRFYDPFHGGTSFDETGCGALYQRLAGRPVSLPAHALDPVAPATILSRMLWNLRSIAEGRGDAPMQFRVLSLLSCFDDTPLQVRLSWASALATRGRYGEAADVVERALPDAPQAARERLRSMADGWIARLN